MYSLSSRIDTLAAFWIQEIQVSNPLPFLHGQTMPLPTVGEQHRLGLAALRGDTPEPMQIELQDDLVLYVMLEKR